MVQLEDIFTTYFSEITHIMPEPISHEVAYVAREIYEQLVWAHKYWDVNGNLARHVQTLVNLTGTIVREEMQEYSRHLKDRMHPVKLFDLKNNELKAEFVLLKDITCLDELPSQFYQIFNKYSKWTKSLEMDMPKDIIVKAQ